MNEKYITAFYHEYPKSYDGNLITSYLSNHIRKQIRETKKIREHILLTDFVVGNVRFQPLTSLRNFLGITKN